MTDVSSLRRPPPEFRRATVTVVEELSPRLVKIGLAGDDLVGLAVPEPAASARLLLPRRGPGTQLEMPTWNGNEFRFGDGSRPPIRTLTPLRVDPEAGSLEVEVVLHGRGALSDWARARPVGDEIAVSGPGRGTPPNLTAAEFVLVGDESAMPAIGQILEHLPPTAKVEAVIEIAHPDARIDLPDHPGATVTWCDLAPGEAPGAAMLGEISACSSPMVCRSGPPAKPPPCSSYARWFTTNGVSPASER